MGEDIYLIAMCFYGSFFERKKTKNTKDEAEKTHRKFTYNNATYISTGSPHRLNSQLFACLISHFISFLVPKKNEKEFSLRIHSALTSFASLLRTEMMYTNSGIPSRLACFLKAENDSF